MKFKRKKKHHKIKAIKKDYSIYIKSNLISKHLINKINKKYFVY